MELSEEQKKRIFEEERQKAAEEQYRAAIRAKLRTGSRDAVTSVPQAKPADYRSGRGIKIGLAILIVLIVVIAFVHLPPQSDVSRPDGSALFTSTLPLPHPFNRPLFSGSVAVSPHQCQYWKFEVSASAVNARVVGNFHAMGGSGNDIQAVVADWSQCENWMNGHRADVLYASGKVTSGSLNVPIPLAGTYCLAFSNRMALLSGKTVSGNIGLQYLVP
jgi:hypothetical protein